MSYYTVIKDDTVNNYYLFSEDEIAKLQNTISRKNVQAFKNSMESLFAAPLESVTEKAQPLAGTGMHDYASLATYFWPDADKPGGPYVRRDGFVNPDGALYDKDKLKRLAYLTYHGVLLYFITDERRYLALVEQHLYNWFAVPEKRMNPHLEYGQFIPGLTPGRPEGIIDYAASFTYALNLLHILERRGALKPELKQELAEWHCDFRRWLLESAHGRAESQADNNHGTFYDLTLAVIEQFLEMKNEIRSRSGALGKRITQQVAPDFSLPKETARTRSLTYSFMGLKGFLEMVRVLERAGAGNYSELYESLKGTVDWLYTQAIAGRKTWPYAQVTPFDEGSLLVFRKLVAAIYGTEYNRIFEYVNPGKIRNPVLYYLFCTEEL